MIGLGSESFGIGIGSPPDSYEAPAGAVLLYYPLEYPT